MKLLKQLLYSENTVISAKSKISRISPELLQLRPFSMHCRAAGYNHLFFFWENQNVGNLALILVHVTSDFWLKKAALNWHRSLIGRIPYCIQFGPKFQAISYMCMSSESDRINQSTMMGLSLGAARGGE